MATAVVTGAAQGLGLATATLLANSGYEVLLTDLQPLEATVARLGSMGLKVRGICGDVASEEFVLHLAASVQAGSGAPDVLVNNAGISMIAPAEQTTAVQWRRVMDVNLLGPFLMCKYLGGLAGVSHRSAYNASKHGLIGLTRTLAAEWGGRGVRVNAVCPGWIKTEMDDAAQELGLYADRDIVNRVPMARFAQASDVAAAIAFLADSEKSGFINGVCLPIDGGWTADASWESLRLSTRLP
jgi:NAD(P)-dependent dehydrogenase (short-subunit alcohol dehydrogenase family)